MKSRWTSIHFIVLLSLIASLPFSPFSASAAMAEKTGRQDVAATDPAAYLSGVSIGTYQNLKYMVEPSTGFPHDHFDAVRFDTMAQFAVMRSKPVLNKATGASLASAYCKSAVCKHTGAYGLRFIYQMPGGTWGSYNIQPPRFSVSRAVYLEAWVKGANGGERFELVLWSYCNRPFPGRPASAVITATASWRRVRIPLADFASTTVKLASLCRLSMGFNDGLSPGGTLYLDQIAFVDAAGRRIHIPLDETTNVSNVGFYIADVIGALDEGLETYASAKAKLDRTLKSLERLEKSYGFPHTHNHVVTLRTAILANKDDRCRQDLTGLPAREPNLFSTVDLGNLAAGLILLRQRIPELAPRASALVNAMEWDWLYDDNVDLLYGCRASDESPSTWWHYDWLAADSRLAYAIAIGTAKIPPASWASLNRSRETPMCYSLWHFEPGWDGGGLFMAFMPGIFLDEIGSPLGNSANRFAKDQRCKALEIGAPAWGWSATVMPDGTYCGYGCLRLEVLVPHASILAADYLNLGDLTRNLQALQALGARPRVSDGVQQFDFGFRASVDWHTRQVTPDSLFIDQSMAFLSLVNKFHAGIIRQHFCQDPVAKRVKLRIPDYANSCP